MLVMITGLIYNTIDIHMLIVNYKSPNIKKSNSHVKIKS